MRKLLLSFTAFASLTAASAFADVWKLGPYQYTADTIFHATTGPGITTTGIRLINPANTTNIFYSTIDLTNPDLELRGVQAQDHPDKVESVIAMGNRKNTQNNGQYIAGINGDFFNMGAAITRTNGHSLVDGRLYNSGAGGEYWDYWASYAAVGNGKDIRLVQNVSVANSITFPDGNSYKYYLNPDTRWTDYLCIYTPAFGSNTGTNGWGCSAPMKLVSGSIETGNAIFEITGDVVGNATGGGSDAMDIPVDGYIISGVNAAFPFVKALKKGDIISAAPQVSIAGKSADINQLVGGCSMIVMDGALAPSSYLSSSVIDHFTSNQARTVIGYNEDRTKLIILVADKHTSNNATGDRASAYYGSTSSGFVLERMGHIMLQLGCYTAMNFDGGGSSQLYNKELGLRNVPYGDITFTRPVANGFFAVSTTPVDNTIASLEVVQKNVKLNSGESFTPKVYGYNKYGVLVNTNVTGFTFTVNSALGSVSGTKFTASSAKNSTHGIVALNGIKCGVRILTNGGGTFVSSGDDVDLEVKAPYVADEPLGPDYDVINLTEQWHFVNPDYNDGWDATDPDWSSETAIKSKPCPRFATGMNGKLYTLDMTTMSIAEIDSKGQMTPLFKLPELKGEINGVKDYYGCAISRDNYGNFLIGHYFTKAQSYNVWTIYSSKTGKSKTFELPLHATSTANGRIDNIGRVVGDLSKDAYVYVAPVATGSIDANLVNIIHFSGDGNIDNVSATNTYSKGIYMAGSGNNFTICQPRYTSIDEMTGKDIDDTFYWYSKDPAGGVADWTRDLFCFNSGNYSTNYCLNWNNYSGLNGFDTFVMDGKRYFAVSYADEDDFNNKNSRGQSIIIKDENERTIAKWSNPDYSSNAGYSTITAVPVNDTNVNIYVYNCTGSRTGSETSGAIAGAMLRLSIGDPDEDIELDLPAAGIEDIIIGDDIIGFDGEPQYYNLQGVRVNNPANGIYIVRRGNQTTKEYIRH